MILQLVSGKGDLLASVDSEAEALQLAGRFIQYYRENAKYLERTYAFVPRVGIERLRAIVVDDTEGLAAALDSELQKAIDAYEDPWLEAGRPKTAHQFSSTLPVLQ